MDIDIQKHIFTKLQELTNKDKELFEGEGVYKYFTKTSKSIIIYDIIIHKFKVLKYDYDIPYNIIDEEAVIFIKLCYDQYTYNVKIISNILYKISKLNIVDEDGTKTNGNKIKNIIKDIFIIFLQRYVNNKEVYSILDLIIKHVNDYYKINITKNDIIVPVSYELQKYNSSNTKMVMPIVLANQILLYKEKQLLEDKEKLQKCFYKINKTDKIYYMLLNENEGEFYINIIYQDTEGDMSYLISTNIIDPLFPEKDIIIEKIKKQIYRYNMPCYIKEDILKICDDKFSKLSQYKITNGSI
jgi:hypothetical protein